MTGTNVLDVAERLWQGEPVDFHPMVPTGDIVEVADDVAFLPSFANVSAMRTDDGLLLVDTGSSFVAARVHEQVRTWTGPSGPRLHTAVYSHGHIDHVFGVPLFDAEAAERGWPAPRVVAHEALPARFDRYILTAGYNGVINQRQFQVPGLRWPTEYRYPDETYRSDLSFDLGGRRVELHHARGETDDHTWTWLPDTRVLCCGDFFIWASPAIRRRCSATRASGPWHCGRWSRSVPSCCCPVTASRSSAPTASRRHSATRPSCWSTCTTRPSR